MLIKSSIHNFLNRVFLSRGGIWIPSIDIFVPKHQNVLLVLGTPQGKKLIAAHNIVTNAGDTEYAQAAATEITLGAAAQFDSLYLSTVNWDATHPSKVSTTDDLASFIAGAESLPESGFPKTNDTDPDNTGGGVDIVSWKYSFTKTDFNDTDIDAGAITLNGLSSWGAGGGDDNILTGFNLTTFAKTANDTLSVFVNHTMNGV